MDRPGPYVAVALRCLQDVSGDRKERCCHLVDQNRAGVSEYRCTLLNLDVPIHALTPSSCPYYSQSLDEFGLTEDSRYGLQGYVRSLMEIHL